MLVAFIGDEDSLQGRSAAAVIVRAGPRRLREEGGLIREQSSLNPAKEDGEDEDLAGSEGAQAAGQRWL
eukprot:Skav202412  [mRNA]  locus=scaffold1370:16991:17632:- [translate_table: standard]